MVTAVLHGFVLALGLILPLGVQNTFVFTQGAVHRRLAAALPAVLTAAVCDTLLITLAIGAAVLIEQTVPVVRPALTGVGVLFLLYMGWPTRGRPGWPLLWPAWPFRGAGSSPWPPPAISWALRPGRMRCGAG